MSKISLIESIGVRRRERRVRDWASSRALETDTRWLPVYKHMVMPENTPIPLSLLHRIIDEAGYRAVFNECLCRKSARCRHYPVGIGCLLLGDSPLPPSPHSHGIDNIFHEASAEEAWELACRAVKAGLVPSVGRNSTDSFFQGIGPRDRRVSVCFCCDCCCVSRG